MATTTTHYGFTKPGVNDYVDISVLNANFDNLDNVIYNNQLSAQAALDDLAPAYDATATYSVGDYVTYNKTLYRCTTAITTAEAFDDTKWTAVKVGGELKSHDARISDLEAGVELEGVATNSFDDGIDSYFKKVVSSIVPVQAGSGTPSPTNVRAISGFTECTVLDRQINQWDEDWEIGYIDGSTGLPTTENTSIRSKNYNLCNPSTEYFAYHGAVSSLVYLYVYWYDGEKNFLSRGSLNGVITSPSTAKYFKVAFYRYGTTYNNNISINYPATDTDYHAYNGTTATISFGTAGTVYGGYVDLINGKLVVEQVMATPTEVSTIQSGNRWYIALDLMGVGGSESINYMKSSHFEPAFRNDAGCTYVSSTGIELVAIPTDQSLNTKALADAWLVANQPQFVYKLATPKEYQLTPAQLRSLVGANRLTSSTGEVTEVEYIKNKTIAWLLDLIRA